MSHTNLVLGGNWGKGEWPEFVDVGHEGSSDGRRYLPQRTCHVEHVCSKDEIWPHTACSECGGRLRYYDTVNEYGEDSYELCPYCPNCGAEVVE